MPHKERCLNRNHGRSNVPIRFCPECGERFKKSVGGPTTKYDEMKQDKARRNRENYCMDCDERIFFK